MPFFSAQAELTLDEQKQIHLFEDRLPKFKWSTQDGIVRNNLRFPNPNQIVHAEDIKASGLTQSYLKRGAAIQKVNDKHVSYAPEGSFVDHYKLADEKGMIYFFSADKKTLYRTHLDNIEGLSQVTTMYEPPRSYTEVKVQREKNIFDRAPSIIPEINALAGVMDSSFARDLLNDPKARNAGSAQLGGGLYWHFPKLLSLGAAGLWEMASFRNQGGNSAYYSAWSLGPAVKTKTLWEDTLPSRFSLQMRFSLRSYLEQAVAGGVNNYKLDVTTLQLSWERPFKNRFGEYFWGVSYQRQWINLHNQDSNTLLDSGTGSAQLIGLVIGQGFY